MFLSVADACPKPHSNDPSAIARCCRSMQACTITGRPPQWRALRCSGEISDTVY